MVTPATPATMASGITVVDIQKLRLVFI